MYTKSEIISSPHYQSVSDSHWLLQQAK